MCGIVDVRRLWARCVCTAVDIDSTRHRDMLYALFVSFLLPFGGSRAEKAVESTGNGQAGRQQCRVDDEMRHLRRSEWVERLRGSVELLKRTSRGCWAFRRRKGEFSIDIVLCQPRNNPAAGASLSICPQMGHARALATETHPDLLPCIHKREWKELWARARGLRSQN